MVLRALKNCDLIGASWGVSAFGNEEMIEGPAVRFNHGELMDIEVWRPLGISWHVTHSIALALACLFRSCVFVVQSVHLCTLRVTHVLVAC